MRKKNYKQLTATKKNTESSRSLIYLITVNTGDNQRSTIKVKGRIDEKDWAILDALFTNFISQHNFKALEEPLDKIGYPVSSSLELLSSARDLTKPTRFDCVVPITGKQIRKISGDRNFTDKKIIEKLSELRPKLEIEIENVKIWRENNKYKKITCNMSFIRKTAKEETGKVAPRTKDPQYKFTVLLEDEAAMLFSNDALNQNFWIHDDTFRKLKESNKKIIRFLSLWQRSNISLTSFAYIQGWNVIPFNLRIYIKRAEDILEEIKKLGYIKDWWREEDKKKTGIKAEWNIRGIKVGIYSKELEEDKTTKIEDIKEIPKEDTVIEAELVN